MLNFNWSGYHTLICLGIAQGLFIVALLVFSKKGSKQATQWLIYLVCCFLLDLVDELYRHTGTYLFFPKLLLINWAVDFLFGPFIYIYVKTLTCSRQSHYAFSKWHFMPFLCAVCVVFYVAFSFTQAEVALTALERKHWLLMRVEGGVAVAGIFSITGYIVASLFVVRRHQAYICEELSYDHQIRLNWLKILLIALLVLLGIYIVDFRIVDIEGSFYPFLVAFFYLLAILGSRQPDIFTSLHSEQAVEQPRLNDHGNRVKKYVSSSINSELSVCIFNDIDKLVRDECLFLEQELSLQKLSESMGLSKNVVSRAINESGGCSFFEFINSYRVQAACKLLKNKNLSVLNIAMECGFKSKSAFYNAFKKELNITPSQYRKNISQSE